MATFQIKDGFCINTSGIDGQEINTISTEIASNSSNTVLPTEKAVKDYVDANGLYLGAFDSRNRPQDATTGQFILDTDLGYMLYRYGSAWINATGTVYEGSVTPSTDTPVRWMENPMTSAGDLIVGGASGSPDRLGVGTEGQVLTIGASGLEWANGGGGGGDIVISSGYEGWFNTITSLADGSHAMFIQTFFPPFNKIKAVCTAFSSATHIPNDLEVGVYDTNPNGNFLLIGKTIAAEQTYSQGVFQKYVFPMPIDISSYKSGITIALYCGRVTNSGYLWPGMSGTNSPSSTKVSAWKNGVSGGCPSSLSMSGYNAVGGFFMTLIGE